MIAKQIQGSNFRKVLDYVHKKSGARQIGSNMAGKQPTSLAAEFQASANLRRRVSQCVYHASLSVSPSEKLSDRQWCQIARTYLHGMEFDGNQYVIYRHTDTQHDHVHIVANRIRVTDGPVVSDSWQYRRAEVVVRQLEEQFGLSPTPYSWEKKKRSPKTGEVRRQRRTGQASKRTLLQEVIARALQDRPTLDGFIDRLKAKEISVRLRKSKEGKIEGISYGLDGAAFQGRQLGRDYAWTSLEQVLTGASEPQLAPTDQPLLPENPTTPPVGGATNQELSQLKRQLRSQYATLALQVRRHPQFQDRPDRDVDVGITLLFLKRGEGIEKAKMVLTQSDTVQQWHRELPTDAYLTMARKYIREVVGRAYAIIEKHRFRKETLELS
jgi:hypothetical protein